MTPWRRLRVRGSASLRHRPFWVSVWSGGALVAWGGYVLCMRQPLSHATAFGLLRALPHQNLNVGAMALGIWLLHCLAMPLAYRPLRALGDVACLYAWCALIVIALQGPQQHPGITLYWMAAGASIFDLAWLIYDRVRRR